MAHHDIKSFLNHRKYHEQHAQGVLSRLFFLMLDDLKVGYHEWTLLMDRYLVDPRNELADDGKQRSTKRGNLGRELRDDNMTFDVFFKGLQFLRPHWVCMDIALGWDSGAITFHEMVLPLYKDPLDELAVFGEYPPTDPINRGFIGVSRHDVDPDNAPAAPRMEDWEHPKKMLAHLYQQIGFELAIGPYHWNRLMERYLNDPRNGVRNNPVDRTNRRGSLNKDLHRKTMTWEVFMKGIRFMGPQWMQVGIEPCWGSGVTTRHEVMVGIMGRKPSNTRVDLGEHPIDPGHRHQISTINVDTLISR